MSINVFSMFDKGVRDASVVYEQYNSAFVVAVLLLVDRYIMTVLYARHVSLINTI